MGYQSKSLHSQPPGAATGGESGREQGGQCFFLIASLPPSGEDERFEKRSQGLVKG
jgi:hypothetical protein